MYPALVALRRAIRFARLSFFILRQRVSPPSLLLEGDSNRKHLPLLDLSYQLFGHPLYTPCFTLPSFFLFLFSSFPSHRSNRNQLALHDTRSVHGSSRNIMSRISMPSAAFSPFAVESAISWKHRDRVHSIPRFFRGSRSIPRLRFPVHIFSDIH